MESSAGRVKLFEKTLAEADVESGLVLEAGCLGEFSNPANCYVDFLAMDEQQTAWPFRCFTGYVAGGLAIKPQITGGWREFVGRHRLKMKDKVIFYQGGANDGVPFVIHFRRTIRLFGVDITQAD